MALLILPGEFAGAFRAALASRGVTLTWLHGRLRDRGHDISLTSLSYWRSSARTPDADARADLIADAEELLALPVGALSSLARRPDVALEAGASGYFYAPRPASSRPPSELVAEAREALGYSKTGDFREISTQQIADVGSEGYVIATTMRAFLQCVAGVITRTIYVTLSENGCAHGGMFELLSGGTIAGRYEDPTGELAAVVVEFPEPLRPGDTALLSMRVERESQLPPFSAGVWNQSTARKVLNWVRFHPDAVPDWFDAIETDEHGSERRPRALDTPTSIHQVRWDFGPGSLELAWGYGERAASDEG